MAVIRVFRIFLDLLGVLMLAILVLLGVTVLRSFVPSDKRASNADVISILRQAGLNIDQKFEVVFSRRTVASPLTGDGQISDCIEISEFEPHAEAQAGWVFGPDQSPQMNSVRSLAMWDDEAFDECFGPLDPASSNLGVMVLYAKFYYGRASDAEVVFYHRDLQRLFFVSVAT